MVQILFYLKPTNIFPNNAHRIVADRVAMDTAMTSPQDYYCDSGTLSKLGLDLLKAVWLMSAIGDNLLLPAALLKKPS